MVAFPFAPDRKITEVLGAGRFTLSAEVIPPRNGTEQLKVLEQIETLVGAGAQFLAVTKGAGGSLRGGSLPIAQAIKERFGRPCIAHFTCRDLTPHEVENQLIDHHYFGIRNILALRGDPPDGQTWHARPGGYNYAHELISQIRGLNHGEYLARPGGPAPEGQERTDFCVGAAAYPEHPDFEEGVRFFKTKIDAGAEYGVTDMLYDVDAYARFRDGLARAGVTVPILPAARVLKSRAQAERMASKFRVNIPKAVLDALPAQDGPGALEQGVELFLKQVERLRALGAPGMHVYVIVDTAAAAAALTRLAAKGH